MSTPAQASLCGDGVSVSEYEGATADAAVEYVRGPDLGGGVGGMLYTRGPDMGGGVGGLLYSARRESGTGLQPVSLKYNLSNGRGDIVAQSDSTGALTWTASYEAYGKRTKETGSNQDKQRGNSKDEDPTGLLNEGFRYRDLETGTWLSRDPAGFVDGPNLYAYVRQNPWTAFDPDGLAEIRVDESDPKFAAVVRAALNAESSGSPVATALQGGARDLPNNITVKPQLSGPATTGTDKDGNITIRVNPRTMSDATMSHELAHGIQQGTSHNTLQEKMKDGRKPNGADIDGATEAGRNALNKIVPVKSAKDVGQESKENEAMRVSNIVNAERTATGMKDLPEDKKTADEFWRQQRSKENVKHQNNQSAMPDGTM